MKTKIVMAILIAISLVIIFIGVFALLGAFEAPYQKGNKRMGERNILIIQRTGAFNGREGSRAGIRAQGVKYGPIGFLAFGSV